MSKSALELGKENSISLNWLTQLLSCHVSVKGFLVQVGNGIELEAVGLQLEPYRWSPCGVTWNYSQPVVVLKLLQTSPLKCHRMQDCDTVLAYQTLLRKTVKKSI